jgi:hypothetical protein
MELPFQVMKRFILFALLPIVATPVMQPPSLKGLAKQALATIDGGGGRLRRDVRVLRDGGCSAFTPSRSTICSCAGIRQQDGWQMKCGGAAPRDAWRK